MKVTTQALRLMFFLTLLTGVVYPLLVTAVGSTLFPEKAGGSLVTRKGQVVGSLLLGQKFESPRNFHSRPSAIDFNPVPSGGTNLSPISVKLKESVEGLIASLGEKAPKDLLFASASGVDPHISPEAALFQVESVAKARGFDAQKVNQLRTLVENSIEPRDIGFLGEETVNVLELNLALDQM